MRRLNSVTNFKCNYLSDNIYTPKPFNLHISVYYWGIGQMGTSVELSDNLTYVLMGAPGIYNWRGSVVQYEIDSKISKVGNFENFKFSYAYIGNEEIGEFCKNPVKKATFNKGFYFYF